MKRKPGDLPSIVEATLSSGVERGERTDFSAWHFFGRFRLVSYEQYERSAPPDWWNRSLFSGRRQCDETAHHGRI